VSDKLGQNGGRACYRLIRLAVPLWHQPHPTQLLSLTVKDVLPLVIAEHVARQAVHEQAPADGSSVDQVGPPPIFAVTVEP